MPDAKAERGAQAARPLSPHLMIYKPTISMVISILHRITGAALYFGTLIVAWLLIAAASGPDAYAFATGVLGSWPGLIVLFGYTWALLHHLAGGIRHFVWDAGYGFDLKTVDLLSWGTAVFSGTLAIGIWTYVILCTGGSTP